MKQTIRIWMLLVAMMVATGNAVARGGSVNVVVANSSDGQTHGSATCVIDGTAVTVTVVPDAGWQATADDVTVVATTATANAEARRASADESIGLGSSIAVEWTAANVFTFALQESQKAQVTVTFSRIAQMTIEMGEAGLRTYSANVDLDFAEVTGLTAYVCNAYDSKQSRMVMLKVTSVPAGTGVLLRGEAGSYEVPVAESTTYLVNLLVPAVNEITLEQEADGKANYVLSKPEGKDVAFYRVSQSGTFGPNKAYLQLPTSIVGGNSRLGISFEETTGIPTPSPSRAGGEWYDLQGRKIEGKPMQKGVYVYNGKKVVR